MVGGRSGDFQYLLMGHRNQCVLDNILGLSEKISVPSHVRVLCLRSEMRLGGFEHPTFPGSFEASQCDIGSALG